MSWRFREEIALRRTADRYYIDNTFDTVRYGRLGVNNTEDHRYGREEQQEARRQGRRHPR